MRIASWNVNSVRTRLEQVLAWLQAHEPDVLCLQETKVSDDLFPLKAFEQIGYHCAISGQKAYNGVALISREPLEDVQVGFEALLPDAAQLSEQKRVISGLLDGVRILNLYVPNGSSLKSEKYPYKLEWLSCLQRYLAIQEEQGDPLCMVGDFNIGLEDRDLGWRIDHIYLSEELLGCATGCVIDKQPRGNVQPSDHAPVVVNLAWPPDEEDEDESWP